MSTCTEAATRDYEEKKINPPADGAPTAATASDPTAALATVAAADAAAAPARKPLVSRAEQNIATAEELKAKGNALFKRGKLRKAIHKYNMVFLYVRGLPTQAMAGYAMQLGQGTDYKMMDATAEERALTLQVVCYTNIANCYFKLKEYRKVMENADKALELNAAHVKAKLHKCKAALMLKDLDTTEALVVELDAALRGGQASLAAPLAAIKARYKGEMKAYNAQQRKQMKKMFG